MKPRLLLLFLVFATGCVTVSLKEPIGQFQESVNTSAAALGALYSQMNELERELYFEERELDKTLEVGTKEGGKPTALLGKMFEPESIRARLDALALLAAFAGRLAELAGSDAPTKYASAAEALGESIAGLKATFDGLVGDPTAKDYAGPVGALVGVLGEMVIEEKRERAIAEAIEEGAPEARRLLAVIEKDIVQVIAPQQRTGLRQSLTARFTYYNDNRGALSESDRLRALATVRDAARRYEAFVIANPVELVTAMRDALEALVKYARSGHLPENAEEFLSALKTFQARAEKVAGAIDAIRK